MEGRGEQPLAHVQAAVAFLKIHSRTALREETESPYPFSVSELLETEACKAILEQQASQLGEPESAVVGTLFAKRYSVFCMGLFGAISLFNLQLSSSPETVRFRMTTAAAMEYETLMMTPAILPSAHMNERKASVTAYSAVLQQHLEPVFQSVAAHTGANVQVMWSLVSHNVQTMYARIERDPLVWQTAERLRLIRMDRDTIFAPKAGNRLALKLRSFQHASLQQAPFLLRKHCCLAYKLTAHGRPEGYCETCPKLSSEERLLMLNI